MSKDKQEDAQENTAEAQPPATEAPAQEPTPSTDQELAELKNTLQRLQAEFENYRKRCDRDNAQVVLMANESLISDLLPITDNFELALKSHNQSDDFHKGMSLIYSQLTDVLESNGVKKIECAGKKFDPHLHEALISEESDGEPNLVLEELQRGYIFHNKVLRHSKVKISKKKTSKQEGLA